MPRRLLFLPVDERFCTRDYFILMAQAAGLDLITPDRGYLGQKKTGPDMDRLAEWVLDLARPGDAMIASVDLLVHGGLIPSRISLESYGTLQKRMAIFGRLKKLGVNIYASVCVTRAPSYDSSEEEPDYWQFFGVRMNEISRDLAAFRSGTLASGDMKTSLASLPSWMTRDFLARRRRNFLVVSRCVDLVAEGILDYLNLTMDDNSEGSLSLQEAARHGAKVRELGVSGRVSIHSGADESSLTLLAKYLCDENRARPRFKIEYMDGAHKRFVPAYEGLPLEEGVKSHIEAAGGAIVDRKEDALLFVHNPAEKRESMNQKKRSDRAGTFARAIDRLSSYGGIAGIACVKYVNGADNLFMEGLLGRDFDWSRFNCAGWNTAGNTIGTVCAMTTIQWLSAEGRIAGDPELIKELQAVFFMEHWAFQANVRKDLMLQARKRGVPPWSVLPLEEWAESFAREALRPYAERIRAATGHPKGDYRVYFPWHRSFELGLEFLGEGSP